MGLEWMSCRCVTDYGVASDKFCSGAETCNSLRSVQVSNSSYKRYLTLVSPSFGHVALV